MTRLFSTTACKKQRQLLTSTDSTDMLKQEKEEYQNRQDHYSKHVIDFLVDFP